MAKILLINANTSDWVTQRMVEEATAYASPGTDINGVTGQLGAPVIATRTEATLAAHSALELAAQHYRGADAVVVGVSLDTGLAALRESLAIPVVGMTEATLLTACLLGGRLGVVVLGHRSVPLYRELIDSYGLSQRLAGIEVVDQDAGQLTQFTAAFEERVRARLQHLVDEHNAETLMIAGAVTTGLAARLQGRLAVPLLEPIGCAVQQAELLLRLKPQVARVGSYGALKGRRNQGLMPALTQLLGDP